MVATVATVGELVLRDLQWASTAPVRVEATASCAVDRHRVFGVLERHLDGPRWVPGQKRVETLGDRSSGLGSRRRVWMNGVVLDETFLAWDPGERWAFVVTRARPAFARSIVEDCRIEPTSDGGSTIRYLMAFDPLPGTGWLLRIAARPLRRRLARTLALMAAQAERSA